MKGLTALAFMAGLGALGIIDGNDPSIMKVKIKSSNTPKPEFTSEEKARLAELTGKEKKNYIKELQRKYMKQGD
ncbi:MAG: hypothetical protein ACXVCY_04370 [Pseudobdellovibrionaceae bacterium]